MPFETSLLSITQSLFSIWGSFSLTPFSDRFAFDASVSQRSITSSFSESDGLMSVSFPIGVGYFAVCSLTGLSLSENFKRSVDLFTGWSESKVELLWSLPLDWKLEFVGCANLVWAARSSLSLKIQQHTWHNVSESTIIPSSSLESSSSCPLSSIWIRGTTSKDSILFSFSTFIPKCADLTCKDISSLFTNLRLQMLHTIGKRLPGLLFTFTPSSSSSSTISNLNLNDGYQLYSKF